MPTTLIPEVVALLAKCGVPLPPDVASATDPWAVLSALRIALYTISTHAKGRGAPAKSADEEEIASTVQRIATPAKTPKRQARGPWFPPHGLGLVP